MNIDNKFLKINMNLKMIIFILLKFICFDESVVVVGWYMRLWFRDKIW